MIITLFKLRAVERKSCPEGSLQVEQRKYYDLVRCPPCFQAALLDQKASSVMQVDLQGASSVSQLIIRQEYHIGCGSNVSTSKSWRLNARTSSDAPCVDFPCAMRSVYLV